MSLEENKQYINYPPVAFGQTGLYIHVPFCVKRCNYCDFYTTEFSESIASKYTKSILNAITNNEYQKAIIDTIYFGGGTPTLLSVEQYGLILELIFKMFPVLENVEITLEANPETVTLEYLQGLYKVGFNRISFGVQSGVERELKALKRLHTVEKAREGILWAKEAGFQHISADLMLGIPYQTAESLRESIHFLAKLPLDHISAYILHLEESVPLYGSKAMEYAANSDEIVVLYLQTVGELKENGFEQYEISNFAKAGGMSYHNLKYWKSYPYLGIGPSAHSFMEDKRFYFSPSLEDFVENKLPFSNIVADGLGGDLEEYLMLRLRLVEGVSVTEVAENYPAWNKKEFISKAEGFIKEGLMEKRNENYALTPNGFLLSNNIIAELVLE